MTGYLGHGYLSELRLLLIQSPLQKQLETKYLWSYQRFYKMLMSVWLKGLLKYSMTALCWLSDSHSLADEP